MQLFSDDRIMSNDQRAKNGYQALADLDTNHDGVISAQDPGFSQLMIWQDVNGDGSWPHRELLHPGGLR